MDIGQLQPGRQAVELVRMESCPAQFILPLVELAADKITRDRYNKRVKMRTYFFLGVLIFGILAGIVYFCWSIITAFYYDWVLGRHVGTIKAQSDAERTRRAEGARARLDNGCDHVFGEGFGGFPPNACSKCGVEKEKPSGNCDHVWRLANEAVPCSYCEKCSKRYVSPRVKS